MRCAPGGGCAVRGERRALCAGNVGRQMRSGAPGAGREGRLLSTQRAAFRHASATLTSLVLLFRFRENEVTFDQQLDWLMLWPVPAS